VFAAGYVSAQLSLACSFCCQILIAFVLNKKSIGRALKVGIL